MKREERQYPPSQRAELDPQVRHTQGGQENPPANHNYPGHCIDVFRPLTTEVPTDTSSSEDPESVDRSLAQKCGWNLGQLSTAQHALLFSLLTGKDPKAEPGPVVLLHCHTYAVVLGALMCVSTEPRPGFWEAASGHKPKVYSE